MTVAGGVELDEVVGDFLVESSENLEQLDRELVALEQGTADRATLSSIFRTIHTIKGTSGFFGFDRLQALTHVGENLLSRLRDEELSPTPEIVTALLAMVDAVRGMLTVVEATNGASDGDEGYPALISTLELLAATPAIAQQSGDGPAPAAEPGAATPAQGKKGTRPSAAPRARRAESAEPGGPVPPDAEAAPDGAAPAADPSASEAADGALSPAPDGAAAAEGGAAEDGAAGRETSRVAEGSIRVDVHALDRIVNLVSELVLARNEILQLSAEVGDSRLSAACQRVDLIAGGLQDEVMRTRMNPIGVLFGRFPRIVRDLAATCGRQVRLDTSGTDTELDRSVIEAIRDPLTHLIRNAVDHGIEPPEERTAAGKSPTGLLRLHAYHQNGQVVVEVGDDGAGIYPAVIRQKAVQKGLLTPEAAAAISEGDALRLIFLPGFSTAAAITGVSGRGVGMDVVKTSIEAVGGTVDVLSTPGSGTTFRIRIPLTLAIIPALMVRAGTPLYAVPTADVVELVGVGDVTGPAGTGIERVHGAEVFRLRGELLPLLDLRELLTGAGDRTPRPRDILVLRTGGRRVGLVVDEVLHASDIVVKPLGSLLQGVPLFAGATILADGSPALILDLVGLLRQADLHTTELPDAGSDDVPDGGPEDAPDDDGGALLCQVGPVRRVVVPLVSASRLEEFAATAVEWSDGRDVVQYRDGLLPLVRLADLGESGPAVEAASVPPDYVQVIVCSGTEGDLGLAVDRVVDLVSDPVTVLEPSRYHGLVGSAVVHDAAVDVVDVAALLVAHGRGLPANSATIEEPS